MNEETIIWVNSVNHLGNIINKDLNDIDDYKMKCYSFIRSLYKLDFSYANVQPVQVFFVLLITVQVCGIFPQKVL